MSDFIKPNIVDEEIILDPTKIIMSKTDKFGTFEFANDYFMEVSGYEEHELMGKSMFCVQHPDMPEVIFKMMWEKLLLQENFSVVVKNLAKSGKYYWSVTNFSFKVDEKTNEIIAIYNRRKKATVASIDFFSKLYKTLLTIEEKNGVEASEKYAVGFLENLGFTYFTELMSQFYSENTFNNSEDAPPSTIQSISPIFDIQKTAVDEKKGVLSIELDEKPIKATANKTTNIIPDFIASSVKIQKNETISITKNNDISISEKLIDKDIKIVDDVIEKVEEYTEDEQDETLIDNSNNKKSFFQRMFGKTEEEIEEERKRKKK